MSQYYHPGMHSNPAYQGEKQRNDPVVIPMSGNSGMNLIHDQPKWSWCSLGWSIISACCCTSICGWFGLMCSMLSYTDHKSGDYDRARYKRRWAWCCSMTGLVLTLMVITAIVVLVVVYATQTASIICPSLRYSEPFVAFCKSSGY